jgi:hypothetical protein
MTYKQLILKSLFYWLLCGTPIDKQAVIKKEQVLEKYCLQNS